MLTERHHVRPHHTGGSVNSGNRLGIELALPLAPNEIAELLAVHYTLDIWAPAAVARTVTCCLAMDEEFVTTTTASTETDVEMKADERCFGFWAAGGYISGAAGGSTPLLNGVIPLYGYPVGRRLVWVIDNETGSIIYPLAEIFFRRVKVGPTLANSFNIKRALHRSTP